MKAYKSIVEFLIIIYKASPFYILGVVLSSILSALLVIGELYISKLILNQLTKTIHSLPAILIFYTIYIILHYSIEQLRIILNNRFKSIQSVDISAYLKELLFHKTKELDLEYYENTEFYNDFYKAMSETEQRGIAVVDTIAQYVEYFLILLLTMTLFFDPVFIIAAVLITLKQIPYLNKLNYNNHKLFSETAANNRRMEYISNQFASSNYAKELKLYPIADFFVKQNNTCMDKDLELSKKYHYLSFKHTIFTSLFQHIIYFLIVIYVGYRVIYHEIPAGDFIFLINSFATFSTTMLSAVQIYPNLKNHSLYIDNINRILHTEPVMKANEEGISALGIQGELSIENISFSYPDEKEHTILKDISLQINQGDKVAIVGYNGSGKTTLINLILALYSLNQGQICYHKISYASYSIKTLQDRFGILFQDFVIYPFSIAENILMRESMGEKDEKIVIEALQFSGLWEKVEKLPKGIHTILSKEFDEEGIYLSGGEYQKLAIARAYGRETNILIFDEPSSALDPILETELFEKLQQLGEDKTVIYISHYLSSTVNADHIILLDNGIAAECGTHQELMKQRGIYYQMFCLQAEQYQKEEGQAYE